MNANRVEAQEANLIMRITKQNSKKDTPSRKKWKSDGFLLDSLNY